MLATVLGTATLAAGFTALVIMTVVTWLKHKHARRNSVRRPAQGDRT